MKQPFPRMYRLPLLCFVLSLGLQANTVAMEHSHDWPVPSYELESSRAPRELPVLNEQAVLSDYLVYAALSNPGLESAFNRWKAAVEKVTQADTLPNPKFTYGYFIEEVETRVGPQQSRLGLMQTFPWFGKLKLRGDVAAEAANMAFEHYQARKSDLFYGVKETYYEYYYLHRALAITEDNIQLMKRLEGVARSQLRAGASQSGVIKAQIELGKLDDRFRSLQDLQGPIVARLNAWLNRPHEMPLPVPVNAPVEGAELREEELFEQLEVANPELRALGSQLLKESHAIDLARKQYYPDFSLGVDYIATDEALMPGTSDSGKDPLVAMIILDIPIWRGKYRAAETEARRRHDSVALDIDQKSNVLAADLKLAVYRFRDAERKIDLYGDTLVPQAEQGLNVTEEAYRSGNGSFLDLIDAERLLLEFQLSHERSLADREISLAEIEKLVGNPLGMMTTK